MKTNKLNITLQPRKPLPDMSAATKTLCGLSALFAASPCLSDEKCRESAKELYLKESGIYTLKDSSGKKDVSRLLDIALESPQTKPRIEEVFETARDAIRIATDEEFTAPKDFIDRFREGLGIMRSMPIWNGPRDTQVRVYPEHHDGSDMEVIVKTMREILFDLVANAFTGVGTFSNGYYFIGACRYCHRIFLKARKDQEFDHVNCRVQYSRKKGGTK